MAVNSSEEGPEAYSVAILPDEGTAIPQCESQLSFSNLSEVPRPLKHILSLDATFSSKNKANCVMENVDVYFPCIADVDIEKGKSEKSKANDEPIGNLNSEDSLTRTLQRQMNMQLGGKIVQLLMDHGLVSPKFYFRDKSVPKRVHDISNNRLRKYKRSASFNSRKVVLLFSVLFFISPKIQNLTSPLLRGSS